MPRIRIHQPLVVAVVTLEDGVLVRLEIELDGALETRTYRRTSLAEER